MRVLITENCAPINLAPGDQIQLTYKEQTPRFFGGVKTTEHVLMSHPFTEARIVDRLAIVELEGGELTALGMDQGIAGVFGRQA